MVPSIPPLSNANRTFSLFCLFVNKSCIVFCLCPNFSDVMQPCSDANICIKPRFDLAKVVNICLAKIFQIPFCNFVHVGKSRLEDHFGHFASSQLPVNIIVNMLCLRFNCDFKLRWL